MYSHVLHTWQYMAVHQTKQAGGRSSTCHVIPAPGKMLNWVRFSFSSAMRLRAHLALGCAYGSRWCEWGTNSMIGLGPVSMIATTLAQNHGWQVKVMSDSNVQDRCGRHVAGQLASNWTFMCAFQWENMTSLPDLPSSTHSLLPAGEPPPSAGPVVHGGCKSASMQASQLRHL
jgi:hypothetical protein